MKGLTLDIPEIGIVKKVPGKGMANRFHMDTDLVGAPRFKTEAEKR